MLSLCVSGAASSALPQCGGEAAAFLWLLLKAVYGLKDAPRLWTAALTAWLLSLGFVRGHSDRMIFHLRYIYLVQERFPGDPENYQRHV